MSMDNKTFREEEGGAQAFQGLEADHTNSGSELQRIAPAKSEALATVRNRAMRPWVSLETNAKRDRDNELAAHYKQRTEVSGEYATAKYTWVDSEITKVNESIGGFLEAPTDVTFLLAVVAHPILNQPTTPNGEPDGLQANILSAVQCNGKYNCFR
jgi:hypothetical protein